MISIKKVLSSLGLAQAASRLRFIFESIKYSRRNRRFLKKHDLVLFPLYNVFETYGANLSEYFMDGEVTAEWIAHKVKPYLSQRDIRLVCEWGMGMGRLIRNFPLHFSSARIVGYDYNDEYVECCKMNYQGISFYTNQLMPPLPKCSESSIDLLVAISIFTHLSDRSIREWFKEFAGKMAPGGVFLFTTHGHGFYQRLTANEKKMFSSGQLVEWKQGAEGKRTFASFHPKTYIRDAIPKEFELLEYNEGSLNEQDTWIVKRL